MTTDDRQSRRDFVRITAATALTAMWPRESRASKIFTRTPGPDLVVYNARVYTMAGASPRAEAFATKNGRFVAVGRTSDIRSLATRRTQLIDAKQMTIVPGFIDCHNHAGGTTLLYEVLVGNPFGDVLVLLPVGLGVFAALATALALIGVP